MDSLPDRASLLTVSPSQATPANRAGLFLDEDFDLRATLSSGAAFGWGRYTRRGNLIAYGEPDEDGWYTAPTYGTVIRMRQGDRRRLEIEMVAGGVEVPGRCDPLSPEEFARWYFRMEESLSEILSGWSTDAPVAAAAAALPGLRLIRVEASECLLSFLFSPQNRIPKIAQILNAVSRRYGRRVLSPWGTFHLPPAPDELAAARPIGLAACGLRYGKPQAKNIIATFRRLRADRNFLNALRPADRSYEEAHRAVWETCTGAGLKVADCVCLFGLGFVEAVPVDVHVFNATVRLYRRHLRGLKAKDADALTAREYRRIGEFYRRRFGSRAGYAQQYLFTAERQRRGFFNRNTTRRLYPSPRRGRC